MQSRGMSALEAVTNLALGWVTALLVQLALFPMVGLQATLKQHLLLSAVFTAVSLIRSYLLRRGFVSLERSDTDRMAP